jgi:CheY-like chemotaxis protein
LTACHEHQIVARDQQEAGEHMTRIRTVVAEDHIVARERLVEMLGAEPDVDVVASCGSGNEAVAAIRKFLPNLVLLDLQMPDLDGFGIIAALGDAMPLTIFVTAYDEFALKAFEAVRPRPLSAGRGSRTHVAVGGAPGAAGPTLCLAGARRGKHTGGLRPPDGEIGWTRDAVAARRARGDRDEEQLFRPEKPSCSPALL